MRATPTYQGNEFEDAISVLGGWMSKNRNVKTIWHDGTAVDADIHKGVVRLPRALCSSGLTEDMVMRGRVCAYHEFGHIADTKMSKAEHPKGALFNILNALEDVRMERSQAKGFSSSPGFGAIMNVARSRPVSVME